MHTTSRPSTGHFIAWSVLWSFVIALLCIMAGAFYTAIVEPDDDKITPTILNTALIVGFSTYQIILWALMAYTVWKRGITHSLRFITFTLSPLLIWFLTPPIPWRLSGLVLIAIAATAVYQTLVIRDYFRRFKYAPGAAALVRRAKRKAHETKKGSSRN